MSSTVVWDPNVLPTLAAVWLEAANRQAVTAAQARIDHLLAADPLANSAHVSEGLYAIEVSPLRVLFEVHDVRRLVRVVFVRLLP